MESKHIIYKHLVCGFGEVGKGVKTVLDQKFKVDTFDVKDKINAKGCYSVLHICFPYSDKFVQEVRVLNRKHRPIVTIVHSTVPMGTMRKLISAKMVYSPIRGRHPHLAEGIQTFVKYFAGPKDSTQIAMDIFQQVGVRTILAGRYEELEVAKLLDTMAYGWNIMFMKEVDRFCRKRQLSFNTVYTSFTESYNEGYISLGLPEVVRPVLQPMPGKIGGHCIIPNAKLLKNFKPAKILLELNETY